MSSLSNLVRYKRFKIKDGSNIKLKIGLDSSETISLELMNCSLNGLFGEASDEIDYNWHEGQIIPSSKIIFDETEYPLGRLVLRRCYASKNKKLFLAFSTVDIRVPVGGKLSKHIAVTDDFGASEFELELNEKGFTLADFFNASEDNFDIFDKCNKFTVFYKEWQRADKFSYFFARNSMSGAKISVKHSGLSQEKKFLMFGSNDYLGLSSHPEVIEAQVLATKKFGSGSTGTACTSGITTVHRELCDKVSKMHGTDDTIVFPSGYAANLGLIGGMARPRDLIIADILSHASLYDGMKLSGAAVRFFKHNDMNHLEKILKRDRSKFSGCLLVTEGVFSMDGTIGSLPEVVSLAKKYQCRTMVDQGHCFGILGDQFTGAAEYLGVGDKIDIRMGLFSKGIGTLGGFVTGSQKMIDWYKFYARSYMFATTFPPAVAAATLQSLELVQKGDLQIKLKENIKLFADGLVELGANLFKGHSTPIFPLEIWDEDKMGKMNRHLIDNGVYFLPVTYPAVSKNRCRFRVSVTSKFHESDIMLTLKILKEAMEKADFSFEQIYEKDKLSNG